MMKMKGGIMDKKKAARLSKRALEITGELERVKALYAELDAITLQLVEMGCLAYDGKGWTVRITDNYESKNVVFRPAAVRRFELKAKKEVA